MANRVATGQRPGARFAQFKLVLLGMSCHRLRSHQTLLGTISMLILRLGESAVGKVGSISSGDLKQS